MLAPTGWMRYLQAELVHHTVEVAVGYHILVAVDPYPCYWSPFSLTLWRRTYNDTYATGLTLSFPKVTYQAKGSGVTSSITRRT
jgi:hypothetical protein